MNDSYKGVYCYTTDKLIGIVVQSCETKNLTQNKFVSSETYSKLTRRLSDACSSIDYKNRLLHRKCDVRIFIHELQDFGKRTSERSERVSFPKSCNE